MPELPEVETIRLQLIGLIIGKRIKRVDIINPKSFIGNPVFITGLTVKCIRRFAKILVMDLDSGLSVAVHLKMSGQLIFRIKNYESRIKNKNSLEDAVKLPDKYTRVVIGFTDGSRLFFNDMRKFGWMRLVISKSEFLNPKQIPNSKFQIPKLKEITNKLGPDPLNNLDEEKFFLILHSSNRPVKLVLMDQEKIGGVGNIYANEALYLSRMNPNGKSIRITRQESGVLFQNLQKVLLTGIQYQGTSSNLYRDARGEKGKAQYTLKVYGKTGEKCSMCGNAIRKIKLGGRGTFYCPECQKN